MMNKVKVAAGDKRLGKFALETRAQLIGSLDQLLRQFGMRDRTGRQSPKRRNLVEQELLSQYGRLTNAATALMIWHSSDDFLNADGSPLPLSRSGRRSLKSLAKRVHKDPKSVTQLLRDLNLFALIERRGSQYLPARRSAVTALPNRVSLAYVTRSIWRLIGTMTHNFSGSAQPRFERQVADVRIRIADLQQFLRFVEEQGQYFIDSIDDWLATRKIAISARGISVPVGVGAFAWTGRARRTADLKAISSRGAARLRLLRHRAS